jgi:uncharacterized membrane protein
MAHSVTIVGYLLHIGGGMLGLVAGTIAVIARKGGALHHRAGRIFVGAMLVMAVFADYLAVTEPDQRVNLFIGTFTIYLVVTAWMAVRRRARTSGAADKIALVVSVCLLAPFAILSAQLATGLPPLFDSAVPFTGVVLVAIYALTTVLTLAVIGDARVVVCGGVAGRTRIARHLWRMCVALTLAFGSGFTNGFARLLPGPYHVPRAFFYPQLVPLGVLVCWLIRLRFTAWRDAY